MVAALILLVQGCGPLFITRIAVGPTVDSFGNIGAEAKLSLGGGFWVGDRGMHLAGTIGGGTSSDARPVLVGGLELGGHIYVGEASTLRGALLFTSRRSFKGDGTDWSLYGTGLNFAVLGFLGSSGYPTTTLDYGWHLGAEAQFEYLFDPINGRGVFSLPLVLEVRGFK